MNYARRVFVRNSWCDLHRIDLRKIANVILMTLEPLHTPRADTVIEATLQYNMGDGCKIYRVNS